MRATFKFARELEFRRTLAYAVVKCILCTGSFGSVRMTLQYLESSALLNVTIHGCKVQLLAKLTTAFHAPLPLPPAQIF